MGISRAYLGHILGITWAQCPIDSAILDCTNVENENEEVTQEITIFTRDQIPDVDQLQYKSHGT